MGKKSKFAFIHDRDPFVRLSLNKILSKYGFQVEEVTDLSQLEDHTKEIGRGIVLADVEIEALETWIPVLKKWNDHFVFMSPLVTEESTGRLKKMGVRRIIKKPVEPRLLKRVIRDICPPEEKACLPSSAGRKKGSRSLQKGGEQS
jgi:DNA-binding response OmpR family regulator